LTQIKSARGGRSHTTVYVRFAPKATVADQNVIRRLAHGFSYTTKAASRSWNEKRILASLNEFSRVPFEAEAKMHRRAGKFHSPIRPGGKCGQFF
jgi:hypothetical protein